MNISRSVCIVAVAFLVLASMSIGGRTEQYPSRPVTLVVPYPAGGLSDIPARVVAAEMSKKFGVPFVVENKVGGSGTVGAAHVANSEPDGYTLFVNSITDVTNGHYMPLKYNIVTDFAPIGVILDGPPLMLAVNANLPFKTLEQLIDYARKNPKKLNFGSSGPGSAPSIAAAMLGAAAKIDIVEVPYRGTSLVTLAVSSGEIQAAFIFQSSAKTLSDEGKIRILASTGLRRGKDLQGVPTMIESGYPDFDIQGFVGLAAPAKTPSNIIQLLNKTLNEIVREESFQARFAPMGMMPLKDNSPASFDAYIRREVERHSERAKLNKTITK